MATVFILIHESDDDVHVTQVYTTVEAAWAGWKFHAIGEANAVGGMFTNDDAGRLLEFNDIRTYRTSSQKFSYRLIRTEVPV